MLIDVWQRPALFRIGLSVVEPILPSAGNSQTWRDVRSDVYDVRVQLWELYACSNTTASPQMSSSAGVVGRE